MTLSIQDRVDRVAPIVEQFASVLGYDDECNVRDLMADLLHYCAANGIDPEKEHEAAWMHFDAEREEGEG